MQSIAMITVGQAPRDDLVPHMEAVFSRKVDVCKPVILARTILARVIDEFLTAERVPVA